MLESRKSWVVKCLILERKKLKHFIYLFFLSMKGACLVHEMSQKDVLTPYAQHITSKTMNCLWSHWMHPVRIYSPFCSKDTLWNETTVYPLEGKRFKKHLIRCWRGFTFSLEVLEEILQTSSLLVSRRLNIHESNPQTLCVLSCYTTSSAACV